MCAVANDPAYGNTIWECYSPSCYRPATAEEGEIVRADFVGWSGLAPVTMLIENIIGLHFDACENTVTFEIFPGGQSGVENMEFNGGKVSIVCTEYVPALGESTVRVTAEKPLKLVVKTNYRWMDEVIDVPAGTTEYHI